MSLPSNFPDLPVLRGNYRSYTVQQKLCALELARQYGFRPTSTKLKIPTSTLFSWKKKLEKPSTEPAKKLGKPLSYSSDKEHQIVAWILHRREKQIPVSRMSIQEHARLLINHPDFKASNGWLDRFLTRHDLVLRRKTTLAQHLPADVDRRVGIFLQHVRCLRSATEFSLVINMDETPAYFDMVPDRTIDTKGAKSIAVRTSGGEKRHITVVLAIASTGETLPPLVIFKGKRIPKDISAVPSGVQIAMQEKGWMTEDIMVRWVNDVLVPYTAGRPTLLVLDSFTGHTTTKVFRKLSENAVTPAVIPGGCTSKIQPLDVCINKPFKSKLRYMWERYAAESIEKERFVTASRQKILDWVSEAWKAIESKMVAKSFDVCGISSALEEARYDAERMRQNLSRALDSDDDGSEFGGFESRDVADDSEDSDDPFSGAL